jgi:VanZ family protein
MKLHLRPWIGWMVGGIALAVLAWASLIPLDPGSLPSRHDKLAHLAAYGTLGAWFGLFLPSRRWLPAWMGLGLFGVGIEFAQGQTTYRSFDTHDILANWLGVSLGMVVLAAPLRYGLTTLRARA